MKSVRMERLESDLINHLTVVLTKLNFSYFSIIEIYLSPNLQYSKIQLSSLNKEINDRQLVKMVEKKIMLIKKELTKSVSMKYFPKLHFVADLHAKRIQATEALLERVNSDIECEV